MKLVDWARAQGISYWTAWRWVKEDTMPVPWRQLPTGMILVDVDDSPTSVSVAVCAREQPRSTYRYLDRQFARLSTYAAGQKLHVVEVLAEVGSGLNGKHRKLLRILRDPKIAAVVVEHRDRFARFGSEYLEAALAADRDRSGAR